MNTFTINSIVCPSCTADLAVELESCPHCGSATLDCGPSARIAASSAFVDPPASERSAKPDEVPIAARKSSMLDQPAVMLAFLFLASLFLGLPFLWRSQAFRTPAKLLITVLVLLETAVIFTAFGLIMVWCWNRIQGLAGTLG
ncbi:MAG: hypothetical protein RIS70_3019 [Planctomycetota bacterium]